MTTEPTHAMVSEPLLIDTIRYMATKPAHAMVYIRQVMAVADNTWWQLGNMGMRE